MFDEASQRQIDAADPNASTWLSANAGSGKTRVLTDRVARLLLEGVSPQNILCLTYTKAAASEMQNRLFKTLGNWAMKDDKGLIQELGKLGVIDVGGSDRLAHARTLFARAIETPGGLRIQTIHSFCSSLLRRFPLESGVSPVFREIEDRSAKLLRQDVVEELADGPNAGTVQAVAQHYTGEDFSKLTAEIVRHRDQFDASVTKDDIWEQNALRSGYSETDLFAEIFLGDEHQLFEQLLPILAASAKSTDQANAGKLGTVNIEHPTPHDLETLISVFISRPGTKTPLVAKIGTFPTKDVREANPDLIESLNKFMLRVEQGRKSRNSLYTAEKSYSLHRFANVFLPEYESRKSQRGWLDFDDLISKAQSLLTDPAVAQWVLFRLDGGIDHILVDEAQDTSPDQWRIVELLAQEFSAGYGARGDAARTIFVVGDIKQSIYSFQGADPREFDRMRQHFAANLAAADQALHERSLEFSFRSSPAILKLVDATFAQKGGQNFGLSQHKAYHVDLPGRVDLWPVVPIADRPDEKEWFDPTDKLSANDHRVVLAHAIADQIAKLVDTESISGENGIFRPISYGDFLILVQRRSDLFHEIIRACKSRELPIAGADRLKIGAELAVKDLTALLSFLVTPDDDLSLAVALRSPLFGVTEAELYKLAHERHEVRLWPALVRQREQFSETFEILTALRNQADFLGPYETIERILTRYDGRRNLLARLGPEAEEGIDAMLNQAIDYERSETPSLTGFLTWLEVEEVEIKRQPDTAGDRIRVMTTHGAKGLESPIVILPDTGDIRARQSNEIVIHDGQPPIWKPKADYQTETVTDALTIARETEAEERNRLLYVALTRAEKWLIVCASGKLSDSGSSWYRTVEAGMSAAGAVSMDHPTGSGLRLQHGDWEARAVLEGPASTSDELVLPTWATSAAASVPKPHETLAPSGLGGAKILPGDIGEQDEEAGKLRGRQLHRLLEHLPKFKPVDWPEIAAQLIGSGGDAATPSQIPEILSEASGVLKNPDLSHLFGPESLAEVDVSANIPDLADKRLHGTIDRLVLLPDRVLIVDFKSNQLIPDLADNTPSGVLAQMGAYLAAVEQIYPDRQIDTAILWTRTAELMPLAHDIVRNALQQTTTS